ncbi:DNA cytosine methyltransferase [Pseudomonas sp. JV245A]|uniref:DNA cytosine methyltransferase n=1 Tax=Pseudomonas sp. JV245A TaxID=1890668 RepID=UPI0028E0F8CE|nr:DNA cytosine methyltransferase [Pseudomonas sp. JV245A]MDT9643592.1 DNA cytosine methyltransferase [Pseudomonas sp. JV245A]
MAAYYNEIDPYAAQWIRNLIAAGHIAPGDVDERSIEDVHPNDLKHYTQCHFFAGIGVWSYALRRAGWPDDRPVWTGSCPCQPFSAAGAGAGFDDERHLWPHFHWLIRERQPAELLGEQVASKDADPWLDLVQADLEAMGYAFGAVAFPSAGVGAPHIRDRTYWVANTDSQRQSGAAWLSKGRKRETGAAGDNRSGRLGHPSSPGLEERERFRGILSGAAGTPTRETAERAGIRLGRLADVHGDRCDQAGQCGATTGNDGAFGDCSSAARLSSAGPVNGLWADADWLFCRDGKWRPVESGTFPLAHGAASRVGRLRAYGNAINAEAATQFIAAYLET